MKKTWYVLVLAALAWLPACEKPELPIPPHKRGDVKVGNVVMDPDYKYQVYFDLGTGSVAGQNLKMDWDLGFETSPGHHSIILNSSKAMFATNAGPVDFYTLIDTTGMHFRWDAQNGDLDATALNGWADFSGPDPVYSNNVYIIDRGKKLNGQPVGLVKVRFEKFEGNAYTFRFANMDNSAEQVVRVPVDTNYNFTFFSFKNGGKIVEAEPPKRDWDLAFTQYLKIFNVSGDTIPYLVTGMLLNHYLTLGVRDSLVPFEQIRYEDVSDFTFVPDRNIIGYNWKRYSFDTNQYEVVPDLVFLVKDADGFYYKLRFIDFYDPQGNKGNPQFEYQRL